MKHILLILTIVTGWVPLLAQQIIEPEIDLAHYPQEPFTVSIDEQSGLFNFLEDMENPEQLNMIMEEIMEHGAASLGQANESGDMLAFVHEADMRDEPAIEAWAFDEYEQMMEDLRQDPIKRTAAVFFAERFFAHQVREEDPFSDWSEEEKLRFLLPFVEDPIERERIEYQIAGLEWPGMPLDTEPDDLFTEDIEAELAESDADSTFHGDMAQNAAEQMLGKNRLTGASCGDTRPFWGPGTLQTSEFMAGSVTAAVIYINRPGGAWGPWEKDRMRRVMSYGHNRWMQAAKSQGASLSFNVVEYDASFMDNSRGPGSWTENEITYGAFIKAGLMPQKNWRQMDWVNRDWQDRYRDIREVADSIRKANGTDWAYIIFAVDRGWELGPTFENGYGCFAYVNGSAMFINSTAWEFTMANHYSFTHELGHVFGALDHYLSDLPCDTRSGYMGYPTNIQENGNNKPGCVGDQVDVMDRFSRQFWNGLWFGVAMPTTEATLQQVGLRGLDDAPRMDVEVKGAYEFPVQSLGTSLFLYDVRYEVEIGANRRYFSPGYEPNLSGLTNYLSAGNLVFLQHKQPWKLYTAFQSWETTALKAGNQTQVQCGHIVFAHWGTPLTSMAIRTLSQNRLLRTRNNTNMTCVSIERIPGQPLTRNSFVVKQGNGSSCW
ncbi:MAG: hypothetical protein KDC35_18305 [Acidobacteria bacterium]|nr:hypothetical protein [Acidobacteriota bacterium]